MCEIQHLPIYLPNSCQVQSIVLSHVRVRKRKQNNLPPRRQGEIGNTRAYRKEQLPRVQWGRERGSAERVAMLRKEGVAVKKVSWRGRAGLG